MVTISGPNIGHLTSGSDNFIGRNIEICIPHQTNYNKISEDEMNGKHGSDYECTQNFNWTTWK
jgi:hypothetical protein